MKKLKKLNYKSEDYHCVCIEELGWLEGHASGYNTSVEYSKDFKHILIEYWFDWKEWDAFNDGVHIDMDYVSNFAPWSDYSSCNRGSLTGEFVGWVVGDESRDKTRPQVYGKYVAEELDEVDKDRVRLCGSTLDGGKEHGYWEWYVWLNADEKLAESIRETLDCPKLEAIKRIDQEQGVYVSLDTYDEKLNEHFDSLRTIENNIPLDDFLDVIEGWKEAEA